MKAYLNPLRNPIVWVGAMFGAAATIFLVFMLAKGMDTVYVMTPLISYVIAGIILFSRVAKYLDFHKTMKKLQAEGKYEELNLEFGKTKAMMNYKVRFGTEHLFVKGSGVIVSYGDIKTLSLKKSMSDGRSADILASIRTPYGTIPLGYVVGYGTMDELVDEIRQRNSMVRIERS